MKCWAPSALPTDEQSPVGDIVNLSPRAGSGKSAHPVRSAGCEDGRMVQLVRHRQKKSNG